MEKVWLQSYPESIPKQIDPDRFQSLPDFFESCCKKYQKKKAATNFGSSLTYSELEEKSRYFASFLQNELGLKKGERFAIMLPNTLQYYIALFGALRAGLIVVNVNPLYTARELIYELKDSEAETLVVVSNVAATVEKALKEVPLKTVILTELGDLFGFPKAQAFNFAVNYIKRLVPAFHLPQAIPFNKALKMGEKASFFQVEIQREDIAFLQYTGGTTGIAKGAVLTHRNILANIEQIRAWIDGTLIDGVEVTLLPLPLYHIFTLTCGCFTMLYLGAESVLITNPRNISSFISEIKKIKFTTIVSINTLCNALLNHPKFARLNFSHLKFTFVGGMAATLDVANRWKEVTGVHLLEGYGLTEASPVLTINLVSEKAFTGGIGYPLPSTEVEIRDGEGKALGFGEEGELCTRGPQVMKEYWHSPEETEKVFYPGSWLRTGDIARIDEKGLVTIVDRKKDMIIVSGFNVYPNEVEEVLMSHPGIVEAAVIGIPDMENGGEIVKAIVVKGDVNLTKEEIILWCKNALTAYKVPHSIEFRKELPKTFVGKVLRRALREEKRKT